MHNLEKIKNTILQGIKNKKVFIGKWFANKRDARKYAKQTGGRRIIYETDNGFLVI